MFRKCEIAKQLQEVVWETEGLTLLKNSHSSERFSLAPKFQKFSTTSFLVANFKSHGGSQGRQFFLGMSSQHFL